MLGAGLCWGPDALAILDEIQVYTDDLDYRGESGLELHVNTTPSGRRTPDYPGDVPPHHGVRITPEFSWGLGNDFDWGLYLPTATDAQWHYHFGGVKLRTKWLPLHGVERKGGWYFGINNELSNLTKAFSDSRWNDEVRVIGGYRGPDWLIRSEEHTSELQSPDTISYAVFCLKKKNEREPRRRVSVSTSRRRAESPTCRGLKPTAPPTQSPSSIFFFS